MTIDKRNDMYDCLGFAIIKWSIIKENEQDDEMDKEY